MKLRAKRKALPKRQQARSWGRFSRPIEPARLPSNIAFAAALGAELTRVVAQKLSQLCQGTRFIELAHDIEFQFVCLSIEAVTGVSRGLPYKQLANRWFRNLDGYNEFNAPMDSISFTQRMNALQLPTTAIECPAAQNLTWLAETLHLTCVEQKILEFAYVMESRLDCVQPLQLRYLRCRSMAHALAQLAIILDEPLDAVVQCYTGPSKLYGLHLLVQEKAGHFVTLDELLNMPWFMTRFLETEYATASDLGVALMQPDLHHVLLPDVSVSHTLLNYWMPYAVADAYEAAAKHLPLTAVHMAELVQWFTRCELDAKALSGLAGKMDFQTLVTATKRYCFERSCAGQPLTAPELVHALHVSIT